MAYRGSAGDIVRSALARSQEVSNAIMNHPKADRETLRKVHAASLDVQSSLIRADTSLKSGDIIQATQHVGNAYIHHGGGIHPHTEQFGTGIGSPYDRSEIAIRALTEAHSAVHALDTSYDHE